MASLLQKHAYEISAVCVRSVAIVSTGRMFSCLTQPASVAAFALMLLPVPTLMIRGPIYKISFD